VTPKTGSLPTEPGCEFCAIARGENQAAELVCSGREWVAFFPLEPATPGHTLVVPRVHVPDLWQADAELASELMGAVIVVGRAIQAATAAEGMNLITSGGSAAEQTVFHLHLHLVPRWNRDGFGRIWPVESRYEDSSLGDVADRIRDACASGELG
jgi:histidine triad (HIT) family protein